MSINEEIKNLKEAFDVLFEKGITVNKLADAAQKRIDDNPYIDMTSRGKEELERLQALAKLPRTGESANKVKDRYDKESGEATSAAVQAMLRGDKKKQEEKEQEAWDKGLVAVGNKGYCFNKWKAPKKVKMNDNNSFQDQIEELKEAFNVLSEKITDLTDKEYKLYKAAGKVRKERGRKADQAWEKGGFDIDNHPMNCLVRHKMKNHPENVTQREKDYVETIRLNKRADHADKVYSTLKKKLHQGEEPKDTVKVVKESFQEQIDSLIEAYTSLLEAGVETEPTGNEKEVSPNKISKAKKDKNGNKVETVSVADELFPYEGNAKEQYNQKIIAKINDMIEGTATLEDLIHLVRQKKAAPVKESLAETLTAIMEVSKKFTGDRINKAALKFKKLEDEETKLEQEGAPEEDIEKATTKKVKYGHKIFPKIDRISKKDTKKDTKKD